MTDLPVILDTPDGKLEVSVVRSARSRRMSIVVKDAAASVRMPLRGSYAAAESYVRRMSGWIAGHVAKQREDLVKKQRGFWLWGECYRVVFARSGGRGHRIDGDALTVFCKEGDEAAACERLLRREVKAFLDRRFAYWERLTGRNGVKTMVTGAESYYGKCFTDRNEIRFSSRVARLPLRCAEYVIVHELCHFYVPDHSAAFYAKVARFMPDYAQRRKEMKEYYKK